ncbi:MAG: DUF3105 domain-containing protein [Candidatus Sungbacteria bacterium]|nr:DUF3105 domain-containing protein [Candidatus Sungbacteria bacterium]
MANDKEQRILQATRKRILKRIVVFVVILAVLGGLVVWLVFYFKNREQSLPGIFYPSVGAEHIPLGSTPPKPYNSNPPSSGGHFGSSANWGVYDYEVNDQIFIHNMEHGGVWIAYKPDVPAKVIDQLKEIVQEYGGSKLVMAPRPANDTDIAVTAWSRVLKFNLSGEELSDAEAKQIKGFYKSYKNHGPEFVPDTMPGIDPKSVK